MPYFSQNLSSAAVVIGTLRVKTTFIFKTCTMSMNPVQTAPVSLVQNVYKIGYKSTSAYDKADAR